MLHRPFPVRAAAPRQTELALETAVWQAEGEAGAGFHAVTIF